MALQPQTLNINFAQGLDQKTDPFQVPAGRFLRLVNSVFTKAGLLTKRNGYEPLPALPDSSTTLLTTFKGNLTAIGTDLKALSAGSQTWVEKGSLQPISLRADAIIRSGYSMTQSDSAVASNGLMCMAYTEDAPAYKYVVVDCNTLQNIVEPTELPDADPTYGTPKVFIVGNYFFILYTALVTATPRLRFIRISINNPQDISAPVQIAQYDPATTVAFDAVVVGTSLYVAYNTTSGGQSVQVTYITSTGSVVTPLTFVGEIATHMSLAVDSTNSLSQKVYVSYYDSVSQDAYTAIVSTNLATILAPTLTLTGVDLANITSTAGSGQCKLYVEYNNTYSFSAVQTHYIDTLTVSQAGVVGTPSTITRALGLASKAFTYSGVDYMLCSQASDYQNTYFLINESGQILARLAYSNGSGYYETGLPNATIIGTKVYLPYQYAATIQSASREPGDSRPAIYAQLGVNLVTFDFKTSDAISSEIGNNLNLTGGILWAYDGVKPTENGFLLFPEGISATQTTGGSMADSIYYYQVTYEWTDNQGNLFRSAPSLPISGDIALGGGTAANIIDIPTLRLTYKIDVPVKIVIYRWSTNQPIYYQVTSIQAPLFNDTTVDSVQYTDTASDASILGNNILYTTGSVLENVAPPAPYLMTLFDNRLWTVSSENRNLLFFSKQVLESTPVEMSDLLTLFAAPNTGSEGSTGEITAIAPMDDKLVIFKDNALGYINGVGPDNTGANNQYSQFTLINSSVGCENQQSIVFTPKGLMFQSNKGIWLLGRDLSTQYIGAPVEDDTLGSSVNSAENIPGTNQVRFTMDSGITLVYDYFFEQWSTFEKVPAISSTLYQELHTYVDQYGRVFQETPGRYLDASSPVLMSFTTNWFALAGLQGFQRFYEAYFLGTSISPFKLNVELAYDFNSSSVQNTLVVPEYAGRPWGGDAFWGSGSLWGGASRVFESRVFPKIQKCESFKVTVTEVYDSTLGEMPGAGLTLSGINVVVGLKKGYRNSPAKKSFG